MRACMADDIRNAPVYIWMAGNVRAFLFAYSNVHADPAAPLGPDGQPTSTVNLSLVPYTYLYGLFAYMCDVETMHD